jgi:hypothetical protein
MQGWGRTREIPLLTSDPVLAYSSGEPRGIKNALPLARSQARQWQMSCTIGSSGVVCVHSQRILRQAQPPATSIEVLRLALVVARQGNAEPAAAESASLSSAHLVVLTSPRPNTRSVLTSLHQTPQDEHTFEHNDNA